MPEFILNTDGATVAQWESLDSFVKGFVEAAFFVESSCYAAAEFFTAQAQRRVHDGQADGSVPKDSGPANIEPESLSRIVAFCGEFAGRNAALLAQAYECVGYDEAAAGRDLYFTRSGSGVGYWSRDALNDCSDEYERLTGLMVAAVTHSDAWNAALAERNKIQTLGDRLSDACGSGEICLDAYRHGSGFRVSFYIG